MRLINVALISHPLNWGIVLAVVLVMSWGFVHAMEASRCNCADSGDETSND